MAEIIIGGLFIYLTAFVGYGICKYNYDKKIRPYASEWIYLMEANWELHKQNVRIKAKELKKRDNTPLEVVEHKPRCWEWETRYNEATDLKPFSTELIVHDNDNSD